MRTSKAPPRLAPVRLQGAARTAVIGDRDLLRSAIENVLRNAVRYSPRARPSMSRLHAAMPASRS